MLPIPVSNLNIAKIMGIDPGTETLGISIISFCVDTFNIVNNESYTYYGSKLPTDEWIFNIHGARFQRIEAHRNNILKLLHQHTPLIIACESPFINSKFPQAGMALVEVMAMVRYAVYQYDNFKPLYQISPSEVKNAIGATGGGNKEMVKERIMRIKELSDTAIKTLQSLDEHSLDSLGVAYGIFILLKESKLKPINE